MRLFLSIFFISLWYYSLSQPAYLLSSHYTEPQLDERDENAQKLIKGGKLILEEGTISLQSESHPIDFRKVEIMVLDEES